MKSALAVLAAGASLLLGVPAAAEAQARGAGRDTAMARQHAQHMAAACGSKRGEEKAACEREFAAMQERGAHAMGVDQYTSQHVFDNLADGGRIELQASPTDSAGVEPIRAHMRQIADAFAQGDFETPGFVHGQAVPGTDVMSARRDRIRYEYRPLPRGGEVRIRTADADALRAIHAFLEFQRREHGAGGRK